MKQRIITAVLAGLVALLAIAAPTPLPLIALAAAALVLGMKELAILLREQFAYVLLFGIAAAAPLAARQSSTFTAGALAGWSMVGMLAIWIVSNGNRRPWPLTGWWLTAGLTSAAWLHHSTVSDSWATSAILLTLLPLWVGDSLAYFVGKSMGKHLIAPKVSPKKTWEGAIGGFIGCLGAACLISSLLKLPIAAGIAVGIITGVGGLLGDLLESRLKRSADLKDSGDILPGHGGILDRLDSFLATSPLSTLAVVLLTPDMFHVKPF